MRLDLPHPQIHAVEAVEAVEGELNLSFRQRTKTLVLEGTIQESVPTSLLLVLADGHTEKVAIPETTRQRLLRGEGEAVSFAVIRGNNFRFIS